MTDNQNKLGPWGFDGIGVNDYADEHRPRIATLSKTYLAREDAAQIGAIMAAAPALLAALEQLESELIDVDFPIPDYVTDAIAKAKPED